MGFILDLIFGDPYFMPHPVRFIGNLIRRTEKFLRKQEENKLLFFLKDKEKRQRVLGFILWGITVGTTFLVVLGINYLAYKINKILFVLVNIYFLYSALASKCLAFEGNKIYKSLEENDLEKSRLNLSYIVGRETKYLNEKQIIKATVETIAENTVDGITSPLFYAFIGSFFGIAAPLAYAYKAVNTLDSMVGYKNEKYENYGFASAKIDDIANYIPARITGIIMTISAFLLGLDFKNSFKTLIRDRRNHKSPNCAYSEAPVAGALGLQLGGTHVYFGKEVYKPTIGEKIKEPENKDIKLTIKIMYTTAIIVLIALVIIKGGAHYV
ncbi:adenosylcobinamide-phosphate synthase CbiB [Clostridium massiliamazoniense]|uniref:adenosylcobinamide-phosphate synthase CbiB n=1 Tax=Clostridium massiliamazoniense TaxID=1347366 RepID=UPI00311A2233